MRRAIHQLLCTAIVLVVSACGPDSPSSPPDKPDAAGSASEAGFVLDRDWLSNYLIDYVLSEEHFDALMTQYRQTVRSERDMEALRRYMEDLRSAYDLRWHAEILGSTMKEDGIDEGKVERLAASIDRVCYAVLDGQIDKRQWGEALNPVFVNTLTVRKATERDATHYTELESRVEAIAKEIKGNETFPATPYEQWTHVLNRVRRQQD